MLSATSAVQSHGSIVSGIASARVNHERAAFGDDPWPHGIRKNRANLERFIGYSLDQGLMEKILGVDELFAASTLDS